MIKSTFMMMKVQLFFIHFDEPNAKAALVCVPKNFDRNKLEYDYFRINECQLIVKCWF